MTAKQQIIKRLAEADLISFEETLVLLDVDIPKEDGRDTPVYNPSVTYATGYVTKTEAAGITSIGKRFGEGES